MLFDLIAIFRTNKTLSPYPSSSQANKYISFGKAIYTFTGGAGFIFSDYSYRGYHRIEYKEVITFIHAVKVMIPNAKQ